MKERMKEWLPIIGILVIVIVARMFIFSPIKVEGHSMDPTLHTGERLISSKISKIERADIITCKEPGDEKIYVIKRIIGLPGETVTMKNDKLFINKTNIKEDYLKDYRNKFKKDKLNDAYAFNKMFQEEAKHSDKFTNNFSVKVPKNKYFVLGDNRLVSKDSRIFGFVDKKMIQGKIVCRFFPITRFHIY